MIWGVVGDKTVHESIRSVVKGGAYNQQPEIGFWNLNKLAETLIPFINAENLEEEMKQYQPDFNRFYREEMSKKLGLTFLDSEFTQLVQDMFQLIHEHQLDYTNFFRFLANYPAANCQNDDLKSWLNRYLKLTQREGMSHEERKAQMDATNPKFILRTHLLQTALDKALKESDYSEIKRLRILLENPFQDQPEIFEEHEIEYYAQETPEASVCRQTSCSA